MICKCIDPVILEEMSKLSPGELLRRCVLLAIEVAGEDASTLEHLKVTAELYKTACKALGHLP